MKTRLNERFWASTRGRIVLQLRSASRTVNDLAEALSLTDNAVRAHLVALERDGLVQRSGTRRGTRKPNVAYALSADAEQLFPKVYGPILRQFLDVLKERTPPKKLKEIVRAVGHRMAATYRALVQADQQERLGQALAVLHELGGFCQSEQEDGKVVLRCSDCPLAAVVVAHQEVCLLLETLLADLLGVPVKERCQKGETPRCAFEVTVARE